MRRVNLRCFCDFAEHNGDFRVRTGDFHVRNGDFYVGNRDFHLCNGDFHGRKEGVFERSGSSCERRGDCQKEKGERYSSRLLAWILPDPVATARGTETVYAGAGVLPVIGGRIGFRGFDSLTAGSSCCTPDSEPPVSSSVKPATMRRIWTPSSDSCSSRASA